MNSDATEAALGLLGLSPLNAPQSHPNPQPHPPHHVALTHGPSLTSSSVGIAVGRTDAPPVIQSALPPSLVPLKRKQPSPALSSPTATSLTPSLSRDESSTKPRQSPHPLATSTPPINHTHPLPNMPTKSLVAPSQRPPPQHPFSLARSASVPSQILPASQLPPLSPSTSQHPLTLSDVPPPPDSDAISCICGFTYDDGFSIACDDCSRWCHAACFGIVQGGEVPEVWKCWVCDPTLEVDKERAVKVQKGRFKAVRLKASHGANGAPGSIGVNGLGVSSTGDEGSGGVGKPASRRRASPGAERKSRRGSAVAAAIEGSGSSRKKRRASILSPANPSSPSIPPPNHASTQPHAGSSRIPHPNGNGPTASTNLPPTPVTFPPDIYPNPAVYAQLLRFAKAWRGVTALNPPSPLIHPPPGTYNDGGYTRMDSQGYRDRYGYSMSPLDNTTPVIMDENAGDVYVPRTVLRTDPSIASSSLHSISHSQYPPVPTTCTPAHLRPPSPRLHVASDPSPFSHTSIYPSPPISNYVSTPVPSSSQPRPYAKSPLIPSTNTISSSIPNDTIPAATLLAPYTATIVPSAAYLADPLNGYAHLGMGKPQVRLVGGGWEVGLDARGVGGVPDFSDSSEKGNGVNANKEDARDGKARWARCGCWPNAVVRPVICSGRKGGKTARGKAMRHKAKCSKATSDSSTVTEGGDPSATVNGTSVIPPVSRIQGEQKNDSSDQDDAPSTSEADVDSTTLSFALFALRDLRADEEIVLGWEWDDGHAVHLLPALVESPALFAPAHLHHLRAQFTSILHALSSTFTTCACGSSTRDCAVRVMERVVEGRWPWPGGELTSEGSEGDLSDINGASEEWDDVEEDVDVEGDGNPDPRPSQNWGLGVNVDMDMDPSIEVDGQTRQVKRRKVRKKSKVEDPTQVNGERAASNAVSLSILKPKFKKAINLGPLVGVKRGFRTREKSPMNGGWGGVEIVPSSLGSFPQVQVEEDPHASGKGKGKAWVADDKEDVDVDSSLPSLPPRMRKTWSQPATLQPEPSQENSPRNHSTRAESWRTQERWRYPPDVTAESLVSASGVVEGGSSNRKRNGRKQGSVDVNGEEEDGADGQETEVDTETEVDGSDDTRQMPPPPMPASLDPTTVSSLAHAHAVRSESPRGSIQWNTNGASATWTPPQTILTPASSGQSSQPPSESAFSAIVTPPSTAARSVPSQVNHGTLSPSTPQAHSSPPVPSVSPSSTFPKLSLHSPDASSSAHLSVLCSPTESMPPSSASASTLRLSDHRLSSPPYRPSKPLHVHPQNESPSFPASLSAPVVSFSPSDGTRDTPAEAQYQQPYRSSPDSRHEMHPLWDAEKGRPANGEAYRVRFASPEILSGMPRLRGRTPFDGSAPPAAGDGVSANADVVRDVKEQGVHPQDHDAMNIEVNPGGDKQRQDGSGPSPVASPGSGMIDVPEDKSPSLSSSTVPGAPYPQAPPDSRHHSIPSVDISAVSESDPSPMASNVDETTSQVEPMAVDLESTQPPREPSPPPPPKVKMSLKDFALRKKKQREEEMAAKALASPATTDGSVLPSSPSVDVKRDVASEHVGVVQTPDPAQMVNSQDVKMNDATNRDTPELSGPAHAGTNGVDGSNVHGRDAVHDPRRTEERVKVSAGPQGLSMIVANEAPDALRSSPQQPARSSTTLSRVSSERNNTDQTQTQVDGKPSTTLTTKMEIMDVMVPSGLVGADDPTPGVVGFAPEPPPPPLTTKPTSETRAADHTVPEGSIPRSVPPAILPSTSTSTSMSTSTSTVTSRANSVGIPPTLNSNSNSLSLAHVLPSRRPSHEDGEITSATPPKTYLPRSHTPPTQPRSFHTVHTSPPSSGPTSSSTTPVPRRPAPPLSRSPLSNNTAPTPAPVSSRPLPSGPRALRGSMSQPTHPYPPPRPSYTGSQYIPRGPSADRDRVEWERGDRPWAGQARPRGRAGSNGWGR